MTPESVFEPAPDVVFRDLGGEAVLLHLGTATYFGLDDVGTRVWHLVVEGRSVREVCQALTAEYDAQPDVIERDVTTLLDRLMKKDLVRVAS